MTAANLSELSDDRLIRLALADDRAAWGALIQRHERKVLLSLLARGVRVDRAKDIAQETWMRLIEQAREGKLAWIELPGLAIRQAMFLAFERRRAADVAIEEAPDVVDEAPSIEARLAARAELERARAELDCCSPRAQQIFALVYDEPGLPHTEAAKRAGLSVQRLRQTLCEVRARLRAAMERSDESS